MLIRSVNHCDICRRWHSTDPGCGDGVEDPAPAAVKREVQTAIDLLEMVEIVQYRLHRSRRPGGAPLPRRDVT